MNAVGIDVSKGTSTVAILRPFGEIVASPFEVTHTGSELSELAHKLKNLTGETKVIMECTGSYHLPIATALHDAGLTVCTAHAQLIHNFGNNTIRKVKTDPADALKIANYGLTHWLELPKFAPEDETRHILKAYSRQYNKYNKLKTMLKNNLISLTDQTFPGVNELFTSPARKSDGHEKWIDFFTRFWHCECVYSLSEKAFAERYHKWCTRNGYKFSGAKAADIYAASKGHIHILPKTEITECLVTQAARQITVISETLAVIAGKMMRLAALLPEYPVVMGFRGVGEILGPQLMAEIGDIFRYRQKSSLVRFAGLEPVANSSGKHQGNEKISKQGSPHLRKTLFQVMDCLLKHPLAGDPVFMLLDRKRAEGKHYYCYMNAGAAKFLRIYYARVREVLSIQNNGA
jgi:transposase